MKVLATSRVSCTIDRTPDQVWRWLEDVENLKKPLKGLLDIAHDRPIGVGTQFRAKTEHGNNVTEESGEITVYQRNERVTIKMMSWGPGDSAAPIIDCRLIARNGNTRLDVVLKLMAADDAEEPGFFTRMMLPFLMILPRLVVKRKLKEIKALIEGRAT